MYKVPNSVITEYSRYYFCFVENFVHPGPFQCTRLSWVVINYALGAQTAVKVIKESKARLSAVIWNGGWEENALALSGSDTEVPQLSCIPTDIIGLELATWKISSIADFLQFLTRYHSLSYLSLCFISNIHEMSSILELLSLSDPSARLSSPPLPLQSPPFLLLCVKTLHLTFAAHLSDALLEMAKLCPNLESLEIIGQARQRTRTSHFIDTVLVSALSVLTFDLTTAIGAFTYQATQIWRI